MTNTLTGQTSERFRKNRSFVNAAIEIDSDGQRRLIDGVLQRFAFVSLSFMFPLFSLYLIRRSTDLVLPAELLFGDCRSVWRQSYVLSLSRLRMISISSGRASIPKDSEWPQTSTGETEQNPAETTIRSLAPRQFATSLWIKSSSKTIALAGPLGFPALTACTMMYFIDSTFWNGLRNANNKWGTDNRLTMNSVWQRR